MYINSVTSIRARRSKDLLVLRFVEIASLIDHIFTTYTTFVVTNDKTPKLKLGLP